MFRLGRIVISLSVTLSLFCAPAFPQTNPVRLESGEIIPSLAGQALTGKWIDLPRTSGGKQAVVIFSFSRAGGHDAQNWSQHLSKDDPLLPVYNVIFLESVPTLFRGVVASEIKRDFPADMQDRAMLMYRDEQRWKQQLQVTDESHACVVVIGPNGEIRSKSSESFSDARYMELRKNIPVSK